MVPIICRMIFDELCVLANGDIVCSCGDPAGLRLFGNVHRDRIADVYDGPLYREARRRQLEDVPDSYCPVTDAFCGGRVSPAGAGDTEAGRSVKTLQLEPISFCNLRCPGCPATQFFVDPAYREDRSAILPLTVMTDVVDQLPDLERLLFYNFGEPFLHPEALPLLRHVRRTRPDVVIHTSTNGIPLDASKREALANESLVDRIVFSIDGAREASYRAYRAGGTLGKALGALEALVAARERAGTRDVLEIHWQYILFDWNDTDEEIEEARARAKGIGVPLRWVLTHTPGASQRFRYGSPEVEVLCAGEDPHEALTCDLKMRDLWEHRGAAKGIYDARLEVGAPELNAVAGGRACCRVTIRNCSGAPWIASSSGPFRLGVKLFAPSGEFLKELGGVVLPGTVCRAAGSATLLYDFPVPPRSGRYALVFDVVEEGVCWFSERGSSARTVPLVVGPPEARVWDPAPLIELAHRVHLGRSPIPAEVSFCSKELLEGTPLEVVSRHVAARSPRDESARESSMEDFRERAAASFGEERDT
ncbi:MAG: radical SAM protein [Acidobacteriota bacterium]|nr:radical SAM protein [Acidobacteriota bacterium]